MLSVTSCGQTPKWIELPKVRAARHELVVLAGGLINEEARQLRVGEEWRMEVTNGAGLLLLCFDFIIVDALAAKFTDE